MICPKCRENLNLNVNYCPKCNEKNFGIYSYEDLKRDSYATNNSVALLINANFINLYLALSNIFEYYDSLPKNRKNNVAFFDDILNIIYNIDIESIKEDLEFDKIYSIYSDEGKNRNKFIENILKYNANIQGVKNFKVDETKFSNEISQSIYQLVSHEFSNDYNTLISVILSIRSKRHLIDEIILNAKKSGFFKNIFDLFKGVIAGFTLNANPFIGIPQLLIMYISDKNDKKKSEQLLDTLVEEMQQINNLVDKINKKRVNFSDIICKTIMEINSYDNINQYLHSLISDEEISYIYINDLIDNINELKNTSDDESLDMFKDILFPIILDNKPTETYKYYLKSILNI